MDLLAQYSGDSDGGDDDVETGVVTTEQFSGRPVFDLAPVVHTTGKTLVTDGDRTIVVAETDVRSFHDPSKKKIYYNAKFEDMHAPVNGPQHPFRKDGAARGDRNHATGHVETAHLDKFAFEEQYNTFQARGYGADPGGGGLVGNVSASAKEGGDSVFSMTSAKRRKVRDEALAGVAIPDGDGDDSAAHGAWAPPRAPTPVVARDDLSVAQKEYVEWHASRREANLRSRGKLKDEAEGSLVDAAVGVTKGQKETEKSLADAAAATSVFHGDSQTNYAGESWITAPKDRKKQNDTCYAPKRLVHTWLGHTKGVQAIRFFPKHGHLILSAGLDSTIKIWDVHTHGKCLRDYTAHQKALKDITFWNDGTRFVSTGWDKKVMLWDTETGRVISTVSSGSVANCVKSHPDDGQQNILLAGQTDKKIMQYDWNVGDVVQEYDQHLGAVNSLTFVDEGRRFVSTSDDKSIRVWEFGIPVTMKYIADPTMHSAPAVGLSPTGNWLACQSMDNRITIYSTKDKFRCNGKKVFKGHANAGYACQVGFSPDGKFLYSGDGDGKVFFWDWKTTRIVKSLKAHDKVTIGCEWHPLEQSKVATCSWDGTIKYWD